MVTPATRARRVIRGAKRVVVLGSGVTAVFRFPCPECRTTSTLHGPSCRFEGVSRYDVEKAYTDVLAILVHGPVSEDRLRELVHGDWSAVHAAVVEALDREHRLRDAQAGVLELVTPGEWLEQVAEPDIEPIRTVYRKGSVPGCHDLAVFALVAWYEMVGFPWEETRARVIEWLRASGTWDRGGFEESTPEDVVDKKRHVFERGYGWKQAAEEAKAVIDRRR